MRCIRVVALLPLLAFLGGCGGSGSGGAQRTQVDFAPSVAYNGSDAVLTATPTTGSAATLTDVTIQSGVRVLRLRIPSSLVDPGQTFTLGDGSTRASYTEDNTSLWRGTGGMIQVTSVEHGKVSVLLSGISFAPDDSVLANAATGGFSVSGPVTGIPFALDTRAG